MQGKARSIVPPGLFNFRSRVPFVPQGEPALFWRLEARGWGLEGQGKNAGLKYPALRLNLRRAGTVLRCVPGYLQSRLRRCQQDSAGKMPSLAATINVCISRSRG